MAKQNGNISDKPTKISIIATDSNDKIKLFANRLVEKYNTFPKFYLQRVEFNQLRDIIFKDSVYMVNEPDFTYKGGEYGVINFNLVNKHQEMLRLNKLFIFYDFFRHETGDILIQGTYIE